MTVSLGTLSPEARTLVDALIDHLGRRAAAIAEASRPGYVVCLECGHVSQRADWWAAGRCQKCGFGRGFERPAEETD